MSEKKKSPLEVQLRTTCFFCPLQQLLGCFSFCTFSPTSTITSLVGRNELADCFRGSSFGYISKQLTFERPAREIMMMCILLGKLTMAQVFWAHEKQPIAAALLAAILFSELSDRVDDVSVKEEYEEAARSFEDRADEVLEECHQEDRLRTQLMLSRKLEYYGGTSVIRLAARGKCIRFMAHPSCQEFLSEVWMGGLSPKYTWFQALGSGCSLEEYISDGWNKLDVTAITLFLIGLGLKMQAYGQVMNTDGVLYGAQNLVTNLTNNSATTSAPEVSSLMTLLSPHLRTATDYFIYTTQPIKSNAFLVDQTNVHFNSTPATTLLVTSTQTVPISSFVQDQQATSSSLEWSVDLPYYVITNNLFTIARIFYALSLVAFYIRLMYIFSFSMVLGPKLIMLKRMIVHDLLPFMLILMNIMVGYGVAFQAISFANGYYTIFEQDKMTPNSTYKKKRGARSLYDAVMTSYFQMLGEFRIAELQGESSKCEKKDMCPQTSARRLTIIMLSTFVLLTQVLMFNLLVATFTSTYNEIEGSSQYFWCYQRYEMIQEFVDRPSVAPPFMLIWYSVELASYLINKVFDAILGRTTEKGQEDSFCQSLQSNPTLERKLTKWEQMTGARRTRADLDKLGGRKWTGGARGDSHAVILRTGAGGGGAGGKGDGGPGRQGPGEETPGSLMKRIGPIFGPETEFIEDRFRQFNEQLEKFATIEDKLTSIGKGANRLMQVIRLISDQQFQIIEKLKPKDGRRLVGHNRKSGKNLILEAVSTAVAGLNTHCSAIEEQIEEKIRIEKQCVKAVLTRPNGEEPESDTVLQPQPAPPSRSSKGRPTTGRILERLVMSHRIWRIVPFNFEKYPGIRMNVPPNKINWKVQYTEYKTFQITEDRLAVPYPGMDDGPEVEPQKLVYNAYDSTHGVTRMSIRGRVHVMRASDEHDSDNKLIGYPLNPSGRSGLYGKGVLPHWGPNHAIVVGLTRPHPKGLVQAELPVIQVAVLNRHQNFCLPWYLTDHRADCEFHECSPNVIKALLIRRVRSIITDPEVSSLVLSGLKAANISLVYSGLLTDHLTADHAWIEAIFLNIHENEEQPLRDELLQVFLEDDQTERALWINVCRQFGMRASHDELLIRLAEHRQAFYHETVHAEHPQ
ncbi:unnamed protein product [Calicophoron daubneyi]|uniref:TRPM-like domain-containing protein n=1 Tax=Calicophoron daubneyi TaxID=300641 RepID=A0AAV2TSI0_CALDB